MFGRPRIDRDVPFCRAPPGRASKPILFYARMPGLRRCVCIPCVQDVKIVTVDAFATTTGQGAGPWPGMSLSNCYCRQNPAAEEQATEARCIGTSNVHVPCEASHRSSTPVAWLVRLLCKHQELAHTTRPLDAEVVTNVPPTGHFLTAAEAGLWVGVGVGVGVVEGLC